MGHFDEYFDHTSWAKKEMRSTLAPDCPGGHGLTTWILHPNNFAPKHRLRLHTAAHHIPTQTTHPNIRQTPCIVLARSSVPPLLLWSFQDADLQWQRVYLTLSSAPWNETRLYQQPFSHLANPPPTAHSSAQDPHWRCRIPFSTDGAACTPHWAPPPGYYPRPRATTLVATLTGRFIFEVVITNCITVTITGLFLERPTRIREQLQLQA